MVRPEPKVVLETARLSVQFWQQEDLEALYSLLGDPITMKFWPSPYDRTGAQGWLDRSLDSYQKFGFGRFKVLLKGTATVIGDSGLVWGQVNGKEEIDLGWIIAHDHQGQGYGTEVAAALLEWGHTHCGLKRIVANMETQHLASKRVAEKIGMTYRETFINPRNLHKDTLLYVSDV